MFTWTRNLLRGKKTYLVSLSSIAAVWTAYHAGTLDLTHAIEDSIMLILTSTLRAGLHSVVHDLTTIGDSDDAKDLDSIQQKLENDPLVIPGTLPVPVVIAPVVPLPVPSPLPLPPKPVAPVVEPQPVVPTPAPIVNQPMGSQIVEIVIKEPAPAIHHHVKKPVPGQKPKKKAKKKKDDDKPHHHKP